MGVDWAWAGLGFSAFVLPYLQCDAMYADSYS